MISTQSSPTGVQTNELNQALAKGRFLTGYTNGGKKGDIISVFLLRSPWTEAFCIEATAISSLSPGGTIVFTLESSYSPRSKWLACDFSQWEKVKYLWGRNNQNPMRIGSKRY